MIVLRNALLSMLALCLQEAIGKQQYKWDDMGYVLYCPCMGKPIEFTLRTRMIVFGII